jgi:hypothetical protein
VEDDGRESISSASEELMGGSMKLSLLLIDMARSSQVIEIWDGSYRGCINGRKR